MTDDAYMVAMACPRCGVGDLIFACHPPDTAAGVANPLTTLIDQTCQCQFDQDEREHLEAKASQLCWER